jgi:hypothetical protein
MPFFRVRSHRQQKKSKRDDSPEDGPNLPASAAHVGFPSQNRVSPTTGLETGRDDEHRWPPGCQDESREGGRYRMWRRNLLEFSLNGKWENQWSLLLVASSSCRITASRLNEAGFWRGGNFTNASICPATIPCMPYIRYACEIIQS